MRPTIWCPGMSGSFGLGNSPSTKCRSVRQTAHVLTRTSSCPGPGFGVGTSRCTSAFPGFSRTIARMSTSSPASLHTQLPAIAILIVEPDAHVLRARRFRTDFLARILEIDFMFLQMRERLSQDRHVGQVE